MVLFGYFVSIFLICIYLPIFVSHGNIPLVVNTWAFTDATQKAWETLTDGRRGRLDAVVMGCSVCEVEQCDGTVGYGGSPDEEGETTLDAMIMDSVTHDVGAVGSLRFIKNAIAVARAVMTHTKHTILVGELATNFAIEMGFSKRDLHTNKSIDEWKLWAQQRCQPNFWQDVTPDPSKQCGPYKPKEPCKSCGNHRPGNRINPGVDQHHHDTIGMLVVDAKGNMAAGTSSNGAIHKIPGRMGDAPLPGAGAYVEHGVGGAAATGDGDVMMRFLPSYHVVHLMSLGFSPHNATKDAIAKIAKFYPRFSGAVIAVTVAGDYGAACHGFSSFHFSIRNPQTTGVKVLEIPCT